MTEEDRNCPLCLELMDLDDLAFFPCKCSYQICRFCWNRIRTEENGLCPACREVYTDQPDTDFNSILNGNTDFTRINNQKKKRKDVNKNKNLSEMMKVLPELRVVQPNLIFVIGLPPWMSKERDQLVSAQYFGKFGKVYKVEINQNQTFTGPQGSSSISAYVTYLRPEDAMRAITELDQSSLHGRQLRVSLGTTKYCSQFLKGAKCSKHECMYLHELGDPEASFTKEQMQNGKHTDYMNKLLLEYTQSIGSFNSEDQKGFESKCTNQSNNNNAFEIDTQHQSKFSYHSDSDRSSPHISESKIISAFDRSANSELLTNKTQSGVNCPSKTNPSNHQQPQKKQKTPSSTRKQISNTNQSNSKANNENKIAPNSNSPNEIKGVEESIQETRLDPNLNKDSNNVQNTSSQNQSSNKNHHQFIFGHQKIEEDPVDIDFDPFSISQNGLAELLAAEKDRFPSNISNTSINNNQDWQNGSLRSCNLNSSTGPNQIPSFQPSQGPKSGSTPQRPTNQSGGSNSNGPPCSSARVMIPPPGFEDKTISGDLPKQSTASHPPGLAHIPEPNDPMMGNILETSCSHNFIVNNHSSKIPQTNGIDQNSRENPSLNSLVKALDFACIAFRIAISLDNPENEDKLGLDLNTFLLHLSDNTGIDYARLHSAITKSSKLSCIWASGSNSSNANQSRFNGNVFHQLGSSYEDLMRNNFLWSNNSSVKRDKPPLFDDISMSSMKNNHLNNLIPSENSNLSASRGLNGVSKTNISNTLATSLLHHQSTNTPGSRTSVDTIVRGSSPLFSQREMQKKISQNSTWHIDDPAIVSTRFAIDSSDTNIRSCLWQPSTQPSFMNPQSGSLVRQITLSNQSSTWSHRNLNHQSQQNNLQTTDITDSLDKKHQSSAQQSIFHTSNIDSEQNLTAHGSRHLHNVINNYSVS